MHPDVITQGFRQHWSMLLVSALTINGLVGDIYAKRGKFWLAMTIWFCGSLGWAWLLPKPHVSFGRTIAWNCVLAYVLTVMVSAGMFHETMTTQQWIGIVFGLVAVVLLA